MKPSEKINRTWELRRRLVEIMLDDGSVEASAAVCLELSPRPQVIIRCELPSTDAPATNEIQTKQQVDISLAPGVQIQAAVGNRWTLGGGEDQQCLDPQFGTSDRCWEHSTSLTRCKFALLNFPHVMGQQDVIRYPERGNTSHWLSYPRFKLVARPWLIDVIAEGSTGGMHYGLTRTGGSAITHVGSITRVDGRHFFVAGSFNHC